MESSNEITRERGREPAQLGGEKPPTRGEWLALASKRKERRGAKGKKDGEQMRERLGEEGENRGAGGKAKEGREARKQLGAQGRSEGAGGEGQDPNVQIKIMACPELAGTCRCQYQQRSYLP